jgi:hypothetical protein
MLKSYEATCEDAQVKWLGEQPSVQSARVIVTVSEETTSSSFKRRTFPTNLAGKVQILGDIVSPIVDEEDWKYFKESGINLSTEIDKKGGNDAKNL